MQNFLLFVIECNELSKTCSEAHLLILYNLKCFIVIKNKKKKLCNKLMADLYNTNWILVNFISLEIRNMAAFLFIILF